jgi:hypothetical protein
VPTRRNWPQKTAPKRAPRAELCGADGGSRQSIESRVRRHRQAFLEAAPSPAPERPHVCSGRLTGRIVSRRWGPIVIRRATVDGVGSNSDSWSF